MILVTGGTGLVGSHLLYFLLSKKEKIRAIYRTEESLEKVKLVFESYNAPSLFEKIEWEKADLLDYFQLKDAFEGIDYVYHSAAMVSFQPNDADKMMKINIEGTENMVNLSLEYKIKKFCYVSSVSALGEYQNNKCTDENAIWQNTKTTSHYSISKYYAENEVWRASQEGLSVVIVNPATILGFGNWNESSLTIIKRVYDGLPFYTPGSNGFVAVVDVVKAMIQLMNSEINNERYLLVSENRSFKTLFEKIATSLGKTKPKYEANYFLANILKYLDQLRAKITRSRAILSTSSIETAFKEKCFEASKIKQELDFEFEPLDITIENCSTLFLKYAKKLATLS